MNKLLILLENQPIARINSRIQVLGIMSGNMAFFFDLVALYLVALPGGSTWWPSTWWLYLVALYLVAACCALS